MASSLSRAALALALSLLFAAPVAAQDAEPRADSETEPPDESASEDSPTDDGASPSDGASDEGSEDGAAGESADDATEDDLDEEDLDGEEESDLQSGDVVVVGTRIVDPDEAPVPALSVSQEEIERQQPVSVSDVVRRFTGITVRDEEGMGLRPNIGFRGLSSDRSRSVLVLEDGVPIQMMPYDYPELYVAPRIERMRSVELVRGAASILYGPRTIGGVVNFVTLEPPTELHVGGQFRIGTDGYYYGHAMAGDTIGDVGFLVTAMHQRFDGPRHLSLAQTDVMGRLTLDLHDAGELRVKLQFYDEDSTSTNLGLTTLQYDSGAIDNFAIHDRFPVRRYAAQITHQAELTPDVTLATTAYFNITTRDWWRQDFLRARAGGVGIERIIGPHGEPIDPQNATGSNDGSSVYFLSTNVGRLRRYTVAGVEPRLTARYDAGVVRGEIIGGVRLHYEQGDDVDIAGASPTARTGDIQAQQTRNVLALAAYVRPTFEFFDRHLEIAPGLRVESMFSSIRIDRALTGGGGVIDGVYQAPVITTYDPPQTASPMSIAFIPGISGTVKVNDALAVYGGVHRGYVPPGIRDAILGFGRDTALQAEWAWNFEWGARGEPARWLRYEATAFFVDYETQVLGPTEATTTPDGDIATSGSSTSYGFEASTRFDFATAASLGFELPLTVAYTFAEARFSEGWARGIAGNVVPYVPAHTLSARLDFAHPIGLEAQVSVDYTSAQYTDPYNTIEATLDGTEGVIDQRAVVNARVAYTYEPWHVTLFGDVRNLFDARYIASRAPAGIQPGMTRQAFVGIRLAY